MPRSRIKKKALAKVAPAKAKKKVKVKTRTKRSGGAIVDVGGMIGGLIAPGIGSTLGRMIGRAGQTLYNHISGSGAYTIAQNSLMGVSNVPSFGETVIRIRAREYLNDVNGSIDFRNRSLVVNPGNATTFPWLSTVASQFQTYKIHGLIFEFVSTSSNALSSTNTALGKVVMATSYNVSDLPFPDVKSALVSLFSNMGKPADNLVHALECKRLASPLDVLYVRSSSTTVEDPKFYDFANFQLITEGMQAVADIGGLWISYDITLSKPTLEGTDATIPSQMWPLTGMSGGLFVTGGASPTPTEPSVPVIFGSTNATTSFVEVTRPLVGSVYEVLVSAHGPAIVGSIPQLAFVSSGINVSSLQPFVSGCATNGVSTDVTRWSMKVIFQVSGPPDDLPWVGFALLQSIPFPGGWTGSILLSVLNPGIPMSVFPSPMPRSSRLETLAKVDWSKVTRVWVSKEDPVDEKKLDLEVSKLYSSPAESSEEPTLTAAAAAGAPLSAERTPGVHRVAVQNVKSWVQAEKPARRS